MATQTFQRLCFLAILLIATSTMEAQCAMCRAVLESEAAAKGERVSEGINNAILFLMGIPYVLMFSVAVYMFRDKLKSLLPTEN